MDYYSRPWEVTADMFGEVDRTHTPGSEFLGQLYFETMKNYPDPIYLERPRPPMPVPSYPFLP